jgi:hypothetical protein
MSFIDQIINGHRSVLKNIAVVWNYKSLLFYLLLSSLVSGLIFSVASLLLGLGVVGIYKALQEWLLTIVMVKSVYIIVGLIAVLVANTWVKIAFSAAIMKRVMGILHRKPMSFSESFDFGKALSRKLFLWSVAFIVIILIILGLGVYFPQIRHYYLVYVLLMGWFTGTLFVLPVLIKRNLPLGKAIQRSFLLAWNNIVEIVSAIITMIFYMLLIGFIVGISGFGLTWFVCYLFNIPSAIGLTHPFILLIVVPTIFLGWYFSTVVMALPATLYHSIVDGLDK